MGQVSFNIETPNTSFSKVISNIFLFLDGSTTRLQNYKFKELSRWSQDLTTFRINSVEAVSVHLLL